VTSVLEGMTVLEFGAGSMPASIAGMLCADNGARVLKVEPPGGDRMRELFPTGFLVWNRGKESVVADLRTSEGRAEVVKWAETADVIISGFASGRLEEWGLTLEELRASNPALITCSISGFGSTASYSKLKCYEGVVAAKCGFYNRGDFGFRKGPMFASPALSSAGAAQMAFSGVLAALYAREESGRGQHLDASMFAGLTPLDYFTTTHFQLAMRARGGKSAAQAAASPGGLFAASRYSVYLLTKDNQWVVLAVQQPQNARALMAVMGLEHTYDDPRFANAPIFQSAEDAQSWETLLWEAFRERTWAELEPLLFANPDLPFERAVSGEQGLDHPQMLHNGHVVTLEDPLVGPVRQVGPVATMERSPSHIFRSAPILGDHNERSTPTRAPKQTSVAAVASPLAGVTIVEFGFFFAMPFGVALAASLGARVIKLEDATGDPIRMAFGGYAGCAKVMEGKESLSIDLKSPEGRAIVEQVVKDADVFVLGFRSGVAERVGLDYETLRKVNPRLVYVHSSGYGPDGPYSNRPMYAQTASATVGAFQRNSPHWMSPDVIGDFEVPVLEALVAPRVRAPADGDGNAALAVCTSIVLGLLHQKRTGEGQLVWTTMIVGNAYAYSDDFNSYAGKPALAETDPEFYGLGALYRLYETREGWIFLAAPLQSEWESLARSLGLEDLLKDQRFVDPGSRRANDDALSTVIGDSLHSRTAKDWEMLLTDAGVGCAEAYSGMFASFCSQDGQIRAADLVVEVQHPTLGPLTRHGAPVHYSETPARIATSCLRGDATITILADLGYGQDAIKDLLERGIVFGPDELTTMEV
jgi:crotonobetainyl-CoA:carnitine CoA-transferase CaiB-like acyl-CoA transferase